jgi:hypothetical protein
MKSWLRWAVASAALFSGTVLMVREAFACSCTPEPGHGSGCSGKCCTTVAGSCYCSLDCGS